MTKCDTKRNVKDREKVRILTPEEETKQVTGA